MAGKVNPNPEEDVRKGSNKVAQLVSQNVQDQSRDSRTCRIGIKNYSKTALSKPKPYPHCCRTVGNAPPLEIKPYTEGSVNFSKPRLRPMGCSGLLSYMFGQNSRIVILFRNPMIQLTRNSKSTAAIAVVRPNHGIDQDLYKDMLYNWDRGTAGTQICKPPKLFVKMLAAEGEGELVLDNTTIKFVMTQDTNAVLSVELHETFNTLPRKKKFSGTEV